MLTHICILFISDFDCKFVVDMDEFKDVSLDRGTRVALHVSNLSCRPKKNTLRETYQKVQHSAIVKQMFLPEIKDTFLRRVEFHAHGGEFVGILGSKDERNELIHLLAGQKKSGEFDGDISLSGSEISAENDYYSKVAFASQVRFPFVHFQMELFYFLLVRNLLI